ncbi:MAG TPA: hypothetical protein VMW04_00715 [Patescibacteria group bacterium]|nr:hypothetical protein [Patescibacteria group bacterium]
MTERRRAGLHPLRPTVWTKLNQMLEDERTKGCMSFAAVTAEFWDFLWQNALKFPSLAPAFTTMMHRKENELKKEGVVIEGLPFFKEGELAFVVGNEEEGFPMSLEEAQTLAKKMGKLVYPVVNADGKPQRCLPSSQSGEGAGV